MWTFHSQLAIVGLAGPQTISVGQESAPEVLNEFPRTPVYGPLEEMMSFLVMAIQGGDSFFALVFLYIQERLLTTQEVLDLLFTRYTSFCPDSEEDEQVKNTICSLLDYWIHKFPQDFCKIEHLPILTRVKNYLIVNMPYSDLLIRVHYMQEKLQSQVARDSGSSNEEASGSTASSPSSDACISRTSVSNLRSGEPSIPTCSAPNLLTSNEDGYSADSSSLCTGAGEHTTSTTSCDKCAAGASCGNSYICYITSV